LEHKTDCAFQGEADERLLKISMNVRPLRTFEKPVQFMTPEQEGTEPPPSPRKRWVVDRRG